MCCLLVVFYIAVCSLCSIYFTFVSTMSLLGMAHINVM